MVKKKRKKLSVMYGFFFSYNNVKSAYFDVNRKFTAFQNISEPNFARFTLAMIYYYVYIYTLNSSLYPAFPSPTYNSDPPASRIFFF